MKFFVEVYVKNAKANLIFEWKKVRPPQGEPYDFDRVSHAVEFIKKWYPQSFGRARVVDSNGEVWEKI